MPSLGATTNPMMLPLLLAFAAAALLAVALTPLVLWWARRLGAVAGMGGRHIHQRSTPRLGGVALCMAMVLPVVGAVWFEPSLEAAAGTLQPFGFRYHFQQQQLRAWGLLVGGLAMCVLGAADDTRGLRARHKLLVQLLVAGAAFACGYRIDVVVLPLLGELPMGPMALPVTVLWIVGIVNALNLIDGLDGLAVGVAFFAGVTNVVVAFTSGQLFTVLVMCAMLGALLGFLLYNFNPARIFAGDSGSYLLGYVLAVTALSGSHKTSTAVALLVPVVALGVPIFDTLYAMVRRLWGRRPLFVADRGHLHHRLLDSGVTHRRAVLILYGVSVAFTLTAIAIYLARSWQLGVALLIASVLVFGLVRFVRVLSQGPLLARVQQQSRPYAVELLRRKLPKLMRQLQVARDEAALFRVLQRAAEQGVFDELCIVSRAGLAPTVTFCIDPCEQRSGASTALAAQSWRGDRPQPAAAVPATTDDEDAAAVGARRGVSQEGAGSVSENVSSEGAMAVGPPLRFALGGDDTARADVYFSTARGVDGHPQLDILLQLLVDVLTVQLTRVGSPFAAAACPAQEGAASGGPDSPQRTTATLPTRSD